MKENMQGDWLSATIQKTFQAATSNAKCKNANEHQTWNLRHFPSILYQISRISLSIWNRRLEVSQVSFQQKYFTIHMVAKEHF